MEKADPGTTGGDGRRVEDARRFVPLIEERTNLREEIVRLKDQLESLQISYNRGCSELAEARNELAAVQQRIADLEASTSWRLTAPIRRLIDIIRKIGQPAQDSSTIRELP